jgi:hypothetical protein
MCAKIPIVFTPDNEPYLGRELLYNYDLIIASLMEQNADTAPQTHYSRLTDHQSMACQVIPQAISITLSIRELIRQGYLFGAHVLKRALIERAVILFYLHLCPNEIEVWKKGWRQNEAPSLAKMFDVIQTKQHIDSIGCGRDLTASMNSLLHAKPDSAPWNLISLDQNRAGHAVSKILNRPDLSDELCAEVIPWIAVVQAMMTAYFPNKPLH